MVLLLFLLSAAWVDTALTKIGLAAGSVDYGIVEFSSGATIAEDWRPPQLASPGSLLKPFVALAYSRKHGGRFPEVTCTGETCWLPAGHGSVGIVSAIANSCNTYFRHLSQAVSPVEVGFESSRLGLRAPPPDSPSAALWGLSADWLSLPQELLSAYSELVRRRREPESAIVLQGLRHAAREGTASALALRLPQDAYAKTGTAECAHDLLADGDGFAAVIYPADSPRYAVIVRTHNKTGRVAASAASAILEALTSR